MVTLTFTSATASKVCKYTNSPLETLTQICILVNPSITPDKVAFIVITSLLCSNRKLLIVGLGGTTSISLVSVTLSPLVLTLSSKEYSLNSSTPTSALPDASFTNPVVLRNQESPSFADT